MSAERPYTPEEEALLKRLWASRNSPFPFDAYLERHSHVDALPKDEPDAVLSARRPPEFTSRL